MTKVFDFCKKKLALEKMFKQKLFVIKSSSQEKTMLLLLLKMSPNLLRCCSQSSFLRFMGHKYGSLLLYPKGKKRKQAVGECPTGVP